MVYVAYTGLFLEAVFAAFLLHREGLLSKTPRLLVCLALAAAAFLSRALLMEKVSVDYEYCLKVWIDFYRENGGFSALDTGIGNYNLPYQYFLALLSYFKGSDLYLIKLFSTFFDIVLAWSVMKIVSLNTKDPARRLAAFWTVLLLPTVILNSAMWAQCDSIYAAMAFLGIYLALSDRPVTSMICMAVSFGFKMQALFILPVIPVLWCFKKYRLWHFILFPLTYIALMLPAVFLGYPFRDALSIYFGQASSAPPWASVNAASIFGAYNMEYLPGTTTNAMIVVAFLFAAAVITVAFICRRRLNVCSVLFAAALLTIGIPFLLPYMHERYFYAAEIMCVTLSAVFPQLAVTILLMQFASLPGYFLFLRGTLSIPIVYGTCAVFITLLMVTIAAVRSLQQAGQACDMPGRGVLRRRS